MNPSFDGTAKTLDPADWQAMRALGHRMVDDMMEYLETLRDRPVWQRVPDRVRERFDSPVPEAPEGAERAYDDFVENVLPYPHGNLHPRAWGWVNGQGTPFGALADFVASVMNTNAHGGDNAASLVEAQVIAWFKDLLGFPSDASGLLLSGGSMANLVGLAIALNVKAEVDVQQAGLAAAPRRMVLYASSQTHSSITKAVRLLGLGADALRVIPVNERFQIDLVALTDAIVSDRTAGFHPFCVVGNLGTVNTGAIDDLTALANLAARERLWFHVDGAFGALAALSPDLRGMTAGMERADSLAFDPHKWMYMPIDVGCVLVRDAEHHRNTFAVKADYLTHLPGGPSATPNWFSDFGIQLSRRFSALKVWMSLKEHGAGKYRALIAQNVEHAPYLARLIDESPYLELLAPMALNVVCFRFAPIGTEVESLDELNERLLVRLQESGVATPSHTVVNGRFALRVANTNHRTRAEDFDLLVSEVVRLGHAMILERSGAVCSIP